VLEICSARRCIPNVRGSCVLQVSKSKLPVCVAYIYNCKLVNQKSFVNLLDGKVTRLQRGGKKILTSLPKNLLEYVCNRPMWLGP
jgi:hypothetical protein